MAAKSNTTASATTAPSREAFIAEYMSRLGAQRQTKPSLVDRLAGYVEDRAVNTVKNSRRTLGRLSAAWEISADISEQAYREEHAKHAAAMAEKFGCV